MTKKIPHFIFIGGFLLLVCVPTSVYAASLTFTSPTGDVRVGGTFMIKVMLDPLAENVFTVKAAIAYPAELLRITSFTFSDTWTPLNQPGFNEINNEKGSIIKTGGYPGGISAPVIFGIITFKGIKEGSATVAITDDSIVFNSESKNILIEKGKKIFSLAEAPPVKIQKEIDIQKPTTKTVSGTVVPDRFESSEVKIPENIPSPDKAWLYIKLAFLSTIALILQHSFVLYLSIAVLLYIIYRIMRRLFA
ncbi:MAG: cohesin domain-containing protein [bacterium]|nr:cohesin domain-containing protein [bacterium]